MQGYLIGCDIGTGGTKAVVIDLKGKIISSHFAEYGLISVSLGWAEQDPEWYWKAVVETIKTTLEKSRVSPGKILGVGLSSQAPGCILVDKNLSALQKSHIWMDRRATAECEWLRKNIGEDKIFKLTANLIDPYYAIPKLMWEKNNRPRLYQKAYKVLNVKDYPLAKLTGKAITDYSHAALGGIAFDIRKKRWDKEILKEIGISLNKLPDFYLCDEVVGKVLPQASRMTGLKEGTPVVAGTVDANAAYLSVGAITSGESALTLGTTACMGLIQDKPIFIPGIICIPYIAYPNQKYVSIAVLVGGGSLIKWFRDNLGQIEMAAQKNLEIDAYDILNLEAEKSPPGSNGLLILPYWMGERSPIWDPLARGVIFGLSFTHTRSHLIRAMMEGVGFAIYHNISLLEKNGARITPPMILLEGGAKSKLWRQIISDISGISTYYMGEAHGAPLGDALMAGVGLGVFDKYEIVKDWLKLSAQNKPDLETNKFYRKLFSLYLQFYPSLKEKFEKLINICFPENLD